MVQCVYPGCVSPIEWAAPYCNEHVKSVLFVEVKQSTIDGAGLGLFALKLFKKPATQSRRKGFGGKGNGEFIVDYCGTRCSSIPSGSGSLYLLQISSQEYIDGQNPAVASVGRYVNTARPTSKRNMNNAKFVVNSRTKTVSIKATRNIYPGQEIFVPYGNSFRI